MLSQLSYAPIQVLPCAVRVSAPRDVYYNNTYPRVCQHLFSKKRNFFSE